MAGAAGEKLGKELLNAAKIVEEHVESEIKRLENMDENDLEAVRQKRLQQLKMQQNQRQVILS